MAIDLRERQRPLKERYRQDPDAAALALTVHTEPQLDDPMVSRVSNGRHTWEMATHAMAGGEEGAACSGDVLLAALAGCQEITLKMVAAAMGITLRDLRVSVTGEMDFRGTLGLDRETRVGFSRITCDISLSADGDPERLRRLAEKAEQYCVVRDTLAGGVPVQSTIRVEPAPAR